MVEWNNRYCPLPSNHPGRNRMKLSTRNHGHGLGHKLYCHGATRFSLDVDFTMRLNISSHKMDAEVIPERKSKTCNVSEGPVPELDASPRWRSTFEDMHGSPILNLLSSRE